MFCFQMSFQITVSSVWQYIYIFVHTCSNMASENIFPIARFEAADNPAVDIFNLHNAWLHSERVVFCEETKALLNKQTKIGMLTIASRFPTNAAFTAAYRGQIECGLSGERYYRPYSVVVKGIRAFFKKHPEYHLLVDTCTANSPWHQCMTYFVRVGIGKYQMFAFEPNHKSVSACIRNLATALSSSIREISIWTSHSINRDGFCFLLSWRFCHSIMYEAYEPVKSERIALIFNMSTHKHETTRNDDRKSSVGYRYSGANNDTLDVIGCKRLFSGHHI